MYGFVARLPLSQPLDGLGDPLPHGPALPIAGLHGCGGAPGRVNVGGIAMLLNKPMGGAVDVEAGGRSGPTRV